MLLYYFCVMFSLFPLRVLYFPCYIEVSLDSKLESNFCFFFNFQRFFKAYCVGWTNGTKHNYTFISCSYYFNRHFVLFFSIFIKQRIFVSKGRTTLSKAALFPLPIRHNYFFKDQPHYIFHRRFFLSHQKIESYPIIEK